MGTFPNRWRASAAVVVGISPAPLLFGLSTGRRVASTPVLPRLGLYILCLRNSPGSPRGTACLSSASIPSRQSVVSPPQSPPTFVCFVLLEAGSAGSRESLHHRGPPLSPGTLLSCFLLPCHHQSGVQHLTLKYEAPPQLPGLRTSLSRTRRNAGTFHTPSRRSFGSHSLGRVYYPFIAALRPSPAPSIFSQSFQPVVERLSNKNLDQRLNFLHP